MIKEILSGLFITIVLIGLACYTTNSVLNKTEQLKIKIQRGTK